MLYVQIKSWEYLHVILSVDLIFKVKSLVSSIHKFNILALVLLFLFYSLIIIFPSMSYILFYMYLLLLF